MQIIIFYLIGIAMIGLLIGMGIEGHKEHKEFKRRCEARRRRNKFNYIMKQTNLRA